jgi:hypothetical protein
MSKRPILEVLETGNRNSKKSPTSDGTPDVNHRKINSTPKMNHEKFRPSKTIPAWRYAVMLAALIQSTARI